MSEVIWCNGKRGLCQGDMLCAKCEHADGEGSLELNESLLSYIRELEARVAEYEKPLRPIPRDNIATNFRFLLACWIETRADIWPDVLDRDSVGNYGKIDNSNRRTTRYFADADYGKTWRCWSRRPTDEERKAAEWDE